jgi:hypothetical protein
LQIGTLRDPDQVLTFSDDIKEDAKGPYLVINKDIEIFFKGEPVDLGEYRIVKLTDPMSKVEKLLAGGFITDEQANNDKEFIEKKGVLFNVNVPPTDE